MNIRTWILSLLTVLALVCCSDKVNDGYGTKQGVSPVVPSSDYLSKKGNIILSHAPGFYPKDISISVESKGPVYYTLNGSVPRPNSRGTFKVENKTIQTEGLKPFSVVKIPTAKVTESKHSTWRETLEMPISGISLRLAEFKGDSIVDEVSANYVISDSIGLGINTVMLQVDSADLFDPEKGIYVVGNGEKENYLQKGKDWERECHMSYFSKKGELKYQSTCGINVHGFVSRNNPQKTLKLTARKNYGKKRFKYEFFKNGIKKHRKLLLRSSFSAWQNGIYNETFNMNICDGLNLEIGKEIPVVVFINGEYWGLHFLGEKVDDEFLLDEYKLKRNEIDVFADNGHAKAGNSKDYKELIQFAKLNDLKESKNYKYFCSQFNIDNLIDWYCAQLFINNQDWPCNNTLMWKKKGKKNKIRHVLIDTDATFYRNKTNSFERFYNYHDKFREATLNRCNLFFRRLLRNEKFLKKFEARFRELLQTTFKKERLIKVYNEIHAIAELEYGVSFHIKRWQHPAEKDFRWQEKKRKDWVMTRTQLVQEQLDEFILFVKEENKKEFPPFPVNGN